MTESPTLPLLGVRACTLVISDTVSQGTSEDRSGPALNEELAKLGAEVIALKCVPDEAEVIRTTVMESIATHQPGLLITSGGTGLSPRDVTPEALQPLCTKIIPGFGELLRADGARHVKTSWLSRSFAGTVQTKSAHVLLIALPGSPKAVREGLEVLSPLLPHALKTMTGARHT